MSVEGSATPHGGPLRVLVVVPTTGGPLLLRRLAPRPGLPHPAAFAEGHYRPLALSADYRALAGPEGPVARHLGAPLPPHELRLSGEPDGGRSWEAPVTLAHLLLAGAWALAADAEEADLLLWATGAVDLDLRLLPGDYALARKVEASRALLEAAGGRRAVAVLPPGPGRDEAAAALRALRRAAPVEVVLAEAVGEALPRLAGSLGGASGTVRAAVASRPRRPPLLRWIATGAAAMAAWLLWAADGPREAADAGLVASVEALQHPGGRDEAPPPEPEPEPAEPEPSGPVEAAASDPPRPPTPATGAPQAPEPSTAEPPAVEPPAPEPPAPAALIEEVRAAPGSSCRAALFDPGRRVLRPVPREGVGYAALPLDPQLCGVALHPAAGATLGPAEANPPGALVAAPSAAAAGGPSGDGAAVLFLSGPPRDVVYAVPVRLGDGASTTVEHRLIATPSPPHAPTE